MCKNCTCVIDLIDVLVGSNTGNDEHSNMPDDGHEHTLFDNVDRDRLEKLKERIIKGKE